jgi:hypothetical protein
MRATHHALVGIRDRQAFAIVAQDRRGAEMQKDLVAHGFDSVVKYDGGSGGYARDGAGGAPEYRGVKRPGWAFGSGSSGRPGRAARGSAPAALGDRARLDVPIRDRAPWTPGRAGLSGR